MDKAARKILFVDDDSYIIRGFRRSLMQYSDWEPYFASSGREAQQVLAQWPIDVLVTDMRMPGMDGNSLLEFTSQNYPDVMRFVLSGNIEQAKTLSTISLAHQLIPKPCDISKVREIVERTCCLRDMLSNPNLARLATNVKKIPTLPMLYSRLIAELQSDDPNTKVVGEIIAQDVAMTAKVLQLVNSAFFGLPGSITSPQKAVSILGINTIKVLVLGSYIFSEYKQFSTSTISIDELWRHSIIVSNLAKSISLEAGLNIKDQEQAQLAGMLHDIGKLLQMTIPRFLQMVEIEYGEINVESEYKSLGASHAELGAYLLALWGFPQQILEAVANHHYPARTGTTAFNIVSAIHTANGLYLMESSLKKNKELSMFLDLDHLTTCQVLPRINEWRQLTRKIIEDTKTFQGNF